MLTKYYIISQVLANYSSFRRSSQNLLCLKAAGVTSVVGLFIYFRQKWLKRFKSQRAWRLSQKKLYVLLKPNLIMDYYTRWEDIIPQRLRPKYNMVKIQNKGYGLGVILLHLKFFVLLPPCTPCYFFPRFPFICSLLMKRSSVGPASPCGAWLLSMFPGLSSQRSAQRWATPWLTCT